MNAIRELVVISGKGGTGKTSVVASLATLAQRAVIADCDVDAADLHLILSPQVHERYEFRSGHEPVIQQKKCTQCGLCQAVCRFEAIYESKHPTGKGIFVVDPIACEGCGVCVRFCPAKAIVFRERVCGEWMISETRCGAMVHARLGVAAENSGKLVTTVRREARRIAEQQKCSLIIVDGPPGIGCPVIASVTGASLVLVITEPTVAGEHDLERVLQLTRHFGISTVVCVNKWDINPEMTVRIEQKARQSEARIVGRIRYDHAFTLAQINAQALVEIESSCAQDVHQVWRQLDL